MDCFELSWLKVGVSLTVARCWEIACHATLSGGPGTNRTCVPQMASKWSAAVFSVKVPLNHLLK
eukprot:XP_001704018.1 Hypothetical protein GL50803_28917 [Giardia lamblia ATCC 50803]